MASRFTVLTLSSFALQLLDHMCELMLDRLSVWELEARHEDYIALMLHFLLTWAGHGTLARNGSAAQACARLHDAICAFGPSVSFERVSGS